MAAVAVPSRITRFNDFAPGRPGRRLGRRPRPSPLARRRCVDRATRTRLAGSLTRVAFPQRRLRRLRRTPALRRLVAETRVTVDDLVAPLFVREGIAEPQPIASLPGVVQHTRESLRKEVSELAALGIPGVILFGVPAHKDAEGSGAWDPDGIVQLALADLRAEVGDEIVLIADLCVDEYTDHGHCGIVGPDGDVDNDATLELYARAAVAQADAGADITAPSGMMDGQVAAIRAALDGAGHTEHARSSPTPPSTPRRSTARSATPSTSPSPAVATARATSRTRATAARRWPRSAPTSTRAPTWSW